MVNCSLPSPIGTTKANPTKIDDTPLHRNFNCLPVLFNMMIVLIPAILRPVNNTLTGWLAHSRIRVERRGATLLSSQENCNNNSSSFAIIIMFLPVAWAAIICTLYTTLYPLAMSRILAEFCEPDNCQIHKFIDISLFATFNLKFECPSRDLLLFLYSSLCQSYFCTTRDSTPNSPSRHPSHGQIRRGSQDLCRWWWNPSSGNK